MTLDPNRFELAKVQYFVDTLTARGQHLIMMVDPAVATGRTEDDVSNYTTLQNGYRQGVFYKDPEDNNKTYEGVVWPGPTAFPDFTAESARQWWTVSSYFNAVSICKEELTRITFAAGCRTRWSHSLTRRMVSTFRESGLTCEPAPVARRPNGIIMERN